MRIGRLELTWLPKEGAEKWNQTWRTAKGQEIKVRDLAVNHMRNIIAFSVHYDLTLQENKVLHDMLDGMQDTLTMYEHLFVKYREDALRYRKTISNPRVQRTLGDLERGNRSLPKQYYDSMVDSL